jgi:hypothetical protein
MRLLVDHLTTMCEDAFLVLSKPGGLWRMLHNQKQAYSITQRKWLVTVSNTSCRIENYCQSYGYPGVVIHDVVRYDVL